MLRRLLPACLAVCCLSPAARADEPPKFGPNKPDEPLAKAVSAEKAAAFLDSVALNWTRERNCGTCHTNYAYLTARPVLGGDAAAMKEVREFFENRVKNWDGGKRGDAPRNPTEVVATASALAIHDARTTGKLHPLTRQALDRMWTLQRDGGDWDWVKCDWPPLEHDDYYGAVVAALGVGLAPDDYAKTEKARAGLAKLRAYFRNTPPPDLHHKALLLWAAQKVDGLMTAEEKEAAVKELLGAQRADGGWSLPSLGKYDRRDGTPNNPAMADSDGYATGLVVYVLRQSGTPADHEAVKRGITWLKTHQRESGRWFTRSLNTDRYHFISHAGTAYAVLALDACGELKRP
jgi:squalene-hopene/tetraprenyl-beta-curcumene cyclase